MFVHRDIVIMTFNVTSTVSVIPVIWLFVYFIRLVASWAFPSIEILELINKNINSDQ